MKKLGYIVGAVVAAAIVAPSIASAETVVIKRGDGYHHGYGARAEYRGYRDHGWRHHGHADKVVIIKKRHHHDY
jgi:hypothetical protein